MTISLWKYAVVVALCTVSVALGVYEHEEHKVAVARFEKANTDLLHDIGVEQAKNAKLEKRSTDWSTYWNKLDDELHSCLEKRHTDLNQLEDIKWQMQMVINTCPGRTRPPKLPRP